MRYIKYTTLFILTVCFLLQVSVSHGSDKKETKPLDLNVAILPYLSYSPFFIALDEGFFEEQGLRIKVFKFARSPEVVPALVQGRLDVAGSFMSVSLLNAIARKANIKLVACRSFIDPKGCTYAGLLAKRSLVESGKLNNPIKLKGRRIVINETTIEGYVVEKLLKRADLSLKDINCGDLPPPTVFGAFNKGSIDLAAEAEPWITRSIKEGQAVMWMPMEKVVPDFQFAFLMYGPTLLKKNSEAGRRFMVAYLKALKQLHLGKTSRNIEIIAKHTKLDRKLLKEACWPSFRKDGRINTQSVLEFQSWAVEKGYMEKTVAIEKIWDPNFIEYANHVLK
jgi:NitT/TauT family transport system substrate-binding protein